ncbi:MAG: cysteine--tRNA ligase [Candidatus Omnitrophota bacterium]|jgi:cysteinyl-tRNA synthetase|nr:MAG: cysteine--tRNA ligase [Candidatus Omnitrophota bacterium]
MSDLYIYNTLTRNKEEFKPVNPKQVNMYICGPTVYDEPHIGHARSAYVFDVIRRYFVYKGYKVKFVRNVTDVDDKIIDKARNEYEGKNINIAVKEVSDKYLASYHQALKDLGIPFEKPHILEPRASEYIEKMVKFIEQLISKGVAYQSGADVYFDITKASNYGKLSHQAIDKMEAGARVAVGENKRNPLDFALWKSAKENEPYWPSPWGNGRPGWHIECSVMSSDILGGEFDIHGGGIDLIFPHHENEIAQSEGLGNKFARYWIHHELLTINGQKMAKSLGNFITVSDVLSKYHQDVLKLFFLHAHYSSPIDYSDQKLKEITKNYKTFVYLLRKYKEYSSDQSNNDVSEDNFDIVKELKNDFFKAMDDNFNTPLALSALNRAQSSAYSLTVNWQIKNNWPKFKCLVESINNLLNSIFGIFPADANPESDDRLSTDSGILEILDFDLANQKRIMREQLKREKKYKEADKIREELEKRGYILLDKKDGTSELRRK